MIAQAKNIFRQWALFSLLLVAVVLVGCASNVPPMEPRARYTNPNIDRTYWTNISRAESLALIAHDPQPPILSYRERIIGNVLTQRTVFANRTQLPGENYLQLRLVYNPYAYRSNAFYDATEHRINWTEADLQDRLADEFPDLNARIDSQILTNLYGHYGFANARAGRDANCVFAWQSINQDERVLPVTIRAMGLEFRFCDPTLTTPQMLDLFSRASLRFETGILPLIDPVSPTREVIDRAQKIDAETRRIRFGPRSDHRVLVFDDDPRLNRSRTLDRR